MIRLVAVAIVAAASPAFAADECDFEADYSHPGGFESTCWENFAAPEGCPVHFLVEHGAGVSATATHDGTELPTTSMVESTFDAVIYTKDFESCTCDALDIPVTYDAIALTVVGGREGDIVSVGSAGPGGPSIVIGPPAPCVEPVWPTRFLAMAACDLCPIDPAPDHAGGCSAETGAGLLFGLMLFGLLPRRPGRAR